MSSQLSRELIKENYLHPVNAFKPETFTHTHTLKNLACGDEITVYITFDEARNTVTEIHFEARACALTIATASMLAQEFAGNELTDISNFTQEKLEEMLETELTINRVKCALLPLLSIQQALGVVIKSDSF